MRARKSFSWRFGALLTVGVAVLLAPPLAGSLGDNAGSTGRFHSKAFSAPSQPIAGQRETTAPVSSDSQAHTAIAPSSTTTNFSSSKGRIETRQVASLDLGRKTREVKIYRPAGSDNSNIPVVYFLHGFPGTDDDPFGAGAADAIDTFIKAGGKPFVFVAPDGNSAAHNDTEWLDSSDGTVELESFITGPLIDAVEGSARRPAKLRSIAGFSMGGFGATGIAERHASLFGQLVSINGYFHFDDPDDVVSNVPATRTRFDVAVNAKSLVKTRVLLISADGDTDPVSSGESQKFVKTLQTAGVPATLQVAHGDHSWAFVTSQYPNVFSFLAQGWRQ